jgi:hypothetical protein
MSDEPYSERADVNAYAEDLHHDRSGRYAPPETDEERELYTMLDHVADRALCLIYPCSRHVQPSSRRSRDPMRVT